MTLIKSLPRGGLGAALLIAMMTLSLGAPALAAESLPFRDISAKGSIGFCDKNKRPVTSGSVYERPFIWTAVSSVPTPKGFEKGKAILIAYQPRKDVEPGAWSGRQLTASSTFTNPKHPMAQATNADDPLLFFIQAFPPRWEGLVQLRLYFSGRLTGQHRDPYPATTIKVNGERWSIVDGGTVPCNVGSATSAETRALPKSRLASPSPLTVDGRSPVGAPYIASEGTIARSGRFDDGVPGGDVVRMGFIGVALLGGGAGGLYLWRRRRSASGA